MVSGWWRLRPGVAASPLAGKSFHGAGSFAPSAEGAWGAGGAGGDCGQHWKIKTKPSDERFPCGKTLSTPECPFRETRRRSFSGR